MSDVDEFGVSEKDEQLVEQWFRSNHAVNFPPEKKYSFWRAWFRTKDWVCKKCRLLPPSPTSLPMRGFMSDEQEKENPYTWEDYRDDMKRQYPIRYWLNEELTMWIRVHIFMRVRDWKWWLADRTWRRQHILDISDKTNGYHRGYSDVRNKIVFANFKLLKEFVEIEMDTVHWESDEPHSKAAKEIMALYKWWTEERKPEWDAYWNREYVRGQYKEHLAEEERLEEKDNEMLKRLADIRLWLWS